jgi:hypothetical protein
VSLNPFPAAGPPGWVVSAWSLAVGAEDSSSVRSAQIRAANQAGYTRQAGYTPQQQIAVGQGLRSGESFALGQGGGPGSPDRGVRAGPPAVIPAPPPPFYPPVVSPGPPYQPPPPGSGGSGSSGIPPRPPSGGGTPGINPNAPAVGGPSLWPLVIGQVVGPTVLDTILRANDYAMAAWNVILGGPRPIPKGPTTRPPVGRMPDRGNPWPPAGAPPQVTVNIPAPREPYGDRVGRILGELGGDIYVSTARLPVPSPPPPSPATVPLWMTLLPIFGPSLMQFLQPGQGNRTVVRLTDPLTRPQPDSPTRPGGGDPFPWTGPLTGLQPSVQSFGAFGGSGAVGTNTCECKAPRKKRRKKKRTVCYSGTFIERRDGTRKTKKRKVQCL